MLTLRAADLVSVLTARGGEDATREWVHQRLDGVPLDDAVVPLATLPSAVPVSDRELLLAAILHQVGSATLDEKIVTATTLAASALGIKNQWFEKRVRAELGLTLRQLEALGLYGLARDFDAEALKRAHRELMKKYHPDRVAHLGDDFAALAAKKTAAMNVAREALARLDPMPRYNAASGALEPDYLERDRVAAEAAAEEDARAAKEGQAKVEAELRARAESEGLDYDQLVAEVDAASRKAAAAAAPPPPPKPAEPAGTAVAEEAPGGDEAPDPSEPSPAGPGEEPSEKSGLVSEWKQGETFDFEEPEQERKPAVIPWKLILGVWAALSVVTAMGVVLLLVLDPDLRGIKSQASEVTNLAAEQLGELNVIEDPLPEALVQADPRDRMAAVRALGEDPESTELLRRVLRDDADPAVRGAVHDLVLSRWEAGSGDTAAHEEILAAIAVGRDEALRAPTWTRLVEGARTLAGPAALLGHPAPDVRLQGIELARRIAERLGALTEYEELLRQRIRREPDPEVKVTLEGALIALHQTPHYEGVKVRTGVPKGSKK